jgi:hypothetical protein
VDIDGYRLVLGWPTAWTTLFTVAVLAFALRNPWLRSWRTVLAAGLVILVIAATLLVPAVPRTITRAAAISLFGLAVIFEDSRLWSLPRADGEFAFACRTALAKLPALNRRIGTIPVAAAIDEFEAIIDELRRPMAPSDEWRELRDEAVGQLSRRLTRVRLGVFPTEDESREIDDQWGANQQQFRRLFDAKRSFWLP